MIPTLSADMGTARKAPHDDAEAPREVGGGFLEGNRLLYVRDLIGELAPLRTPSALPA